MSGRSSTRSGVFDSSYDAARTASSKCLLRRARLRPGYPRQRFKNTLTPSGGNLKEILMRRSRAERFTVWSRTYERAGMSRYWNMRLPARAQDASANQFGVRRILAHGLAALGIEGRTKLALKREVD